MGSTKTETQVAEMPEFQKEFLTETVIPFAQDFLATEYKPYEGERVAGMTPLQQQAMGGYGALSMGGPQYGKAADAFSQLAKFQAPTGQAAQIDPTRTLAGANLDPYMSPYQQNVIDAAMRDIGQQQEQSLNTLGAQATAAKAFGGSRHGIAEAETRRGYGQTAADVASQLRQQGFTQAQAAAQADILAQNQRAQQQAALQQQMELANQQAALSGAGVQAAGASGLGSIAGQQLQSQLAGLGAQMQAGEVSRGLEQARLDVPYQDYLAAMQYPLTQFGVLTGTAGAIPTGYGTTTNTTRTGGLGTALGTLGSLGMGAAGLGMFGPAAQGAVGGLSFNPFSR